jgi:uncharacterized protein (DUF4415 family)
MESVMKQETISSKTRFDPVFVAAAIAAAPEHSDYDPENPPSAEGEWKGAIVSHSYAELKVKLAARRRRGPQKAPTKKATAIRFDPDVLDGLRSLGRGWQTRVNDALRDWLKTQQQSCDTRY